jgi:hypothetical protein
MMMLVYETILWSNGASAIYRVVTQARPLSSSSAISRLCNFTYAAIVSDI